MDCSPTGPSEPATRSPGSRKTQIVGGLIGGSVIMFAALAPEAWMALALLAVAYSSLTVAGNGSW